MRRVAGFDEVVVVDFEFSQPSGECPRPVCMVAHELISGRRHLLSAEQLRLNAAPPYSIDDRTLVVAYYAPAEMACHLALGWTLPEHVLDLYVEFRNLTNGLELPAGRGLLGALVYHGIDAMEATEKESMRELAQVNRSLTEDEQRALLQYCEQDVLSTSRLLDAMLPKIDLPRAVLRGRYTKAVAQMERVGIPIDIERLTALRENWSAIQGRLIARVDASYNVYEGQSFKTHRFAKYLNTHGIAWPQLDSGRLQLDDDTFRRMARLHPQLEPLRQLRAALGQMRLTGITVGGDGKNRCMLSPYASVTGRNQPSTKQFIFSSAAWLRGLIKPPSGWGLAYVDWSQQEFGAAAALSEDDAMLKAYQSGDPYLAYGKQTGLIPPDGTKLSHESLRDQCKQCILAVQYGMSAESLAETLGVPAWQGKKLLTLHKETYRKYWRWSGAALMRARLNLSLQTAYGWTLHVTAKTKERTIANFPMQGNGAELLRLACCFATERGVRICAPVHDALLIEAPLEQLDEQIHITEQAMGEASEIVLNGLRLRTDAKVVRHPERYSDKRGEKMWSLVWEIVDELKMAG